jgi:hypothetical protein
MGRRHGDFVAWPHLDDTVEASCARLRGVVRAVARAAERSGGLIRGIEIRVACPEDNAPHAAAETELDALPPRIADILERAEAGLRR